MTKRLQFSDKIHALLKDNGYEENVYFQPPPTVSMKYPCVRYTRGSVEARYADDIRYLHKDRYELIVIDPNPDSEIPDLILDNFRYSRLDRRYTTDNLNHTSITVYF